MNAPLTPPPDKYTKGILHLLLHAAIVAVALVLLDVNSPRGFDPDRDWPRQPSAERLKELNEKSPAWRRLNEKLKRRSASQASGGAALETVASAGASRPDTVSPASKPVTAPAIQEGRIVLTAEALRVHRAGLLIDGHNDLLWQIRTKAGSSFDRMDISHHQGMLHTDIPRLRQGGIAAQFWAVYVPPETEHAGGAARMALEQFDLIESMIDRYPETFERATTAADIERIHNNGRIACLIGIEGGYMIENSLDTLALFYRRGAHYMGLTHSTTTDWADSGTDAPRHGGLAPFGERVVREMNRLGMMVDLAHVSADCMRAALRVSRAPVIVSHAATFAVAPHARNVPDDVLRAIKQNRGIVMITFFPGYAHPDGARAMAEYFEQERALKAKYPDPAAFKAAWQAWKDAHPISPGNVGMVVDHIDHVVRVAGIDHVGLGSDYDGVGLMPVQLEDVSGYPYITQELLNRGYSVPDIHRIMGGNMLRVMREVEQVARELERK